MKILIVEDDDATRLFFAGVAKNEGLEVKTAPDGKEGLALFKQFKPDMVLSDIQMPKMDGLQLLEQIRKIDFDAIVIIISSMDSPAYTLKALRLRANDYLVKPAMEKDIVALLQKYKDVLSTRTKAREVVGLIFRRDLGMRLANDLELVGKVVDRLMLETEHLIPPSEKLGIHLGLVEIITNSIEHGNLEISYDEKGSAMEGSPDAWSKLVATRKSSPPYSGRQVIVEFRMDQNICEWLITDQGPGFDWQNLPDPNDPENLLESHGRGIMLTRLQFDECEFLEKGNRVRLVKKIAGDLKK